MNTFDNPGSTFIERVTVRLKRAATRRHLLALGDRQLADMGYSRALLEEGVRAWPWREVDESWPAPAPRAPRYVLPVAGSGAEPVPHAMPKAA